jgi:peptidoglycan/xylan/chitin deacetylase (PgdA/CDA1 family)
MSSVQVQELYRAGMQIGAHTVSHPILARLSRDEARSEIADGKKRLEDLLGERISLFAYPNGRPDVDYAQDHVALVHELGFEAAFSTRPGAAAMDADLMQLPRFTPWDRGRLRFGARLAANLFPAR